MASGNAGGGGKLRVTWVKSAIGRQGLQKITVRGLGLRRLHQTVDLQDTPAVRGMIRKVVHLVRVEELH
ncbi:MAG: 50S ribosomal protein L30 [Deltaproteobacteria bacterium RBG_13_65_10]|nr:MAG: 50S ribosomal protein L30 [Deltaproteobacteria bacterium RBG_13_65_10]